MNTESSIQPTHESLMGLKEVPALALEHGTLHRLGHQLRGPLTVISSYAELLADQVSGELSEEQCAQAQTILSAADRLALMLERLSALAEGARFVPAAERRAIDVGELYAELAGAYAERFFEAGLDFKVEELSAPCTVLGDRAGLHLAMTQLLDNALEFCSSGGSVRLSLDLNKPLEVSRTQAILRVWNSGPVIDALELKRIFEPFSSLSVEREGASQEGIGIGLALCRQVLEALGGQVWASSDQEQGTAFYVGLACAEPQEQHSLGKASG